MVVVVKSICFKIAIGTEVVLSIVYVGWKRSNVFF